MLLKRGTPPFENFLFQFLASKGRRRKEGTYHGKEEKENVSGQKGSQHSDYCVLRAVYRHGRVDGMGAQRLKFHV